LSRITLLSQGLPHYAHLVGLHTARHALDQQSLRAEMGSVESAIARAVEDAHQSIKTAHHSAVTSARPGNLFADVLLACALAKTDDMGAFAAQDVRPPMRAI